jgi:hypothetical protein
LLCGWQWVWVLHGGSPSFFPSERSLSHAHTCGVSPGPHLHSTAECVYGARVCSSTGTKLTHAVVLAGQTRYCDMSLVVARKGGWLEVVRPDWQRVEVAMKFEPSPPDALRATCVAAVWWLGMGEC